MRIITIKGNLILFQPKIRFVPVLLFFALSVSCAEDDIADDPYYSSMNYVVLTKDYYKAVANDTTSVCINWNHPALEEMRKRAKAIGNIKWTPKGVIPNNNGVFTKGVEFTGIPYSSVKEKDKFIGQDVSFYTFLSAVNNPRSVLYTEDVRKLPYHGVNCAAYYGTVCSGAVNYALGLDRPYSSRMYGALPCFKRVAQQDLEHTAPGDIVYFTYGHVFLITDIIKDKDGSVGYVDILESAPNLTSCRRYSAQEVQERLDKYKHVIYRYVDLEKLAIDPSPFPAMEACINNKRTDNDALSLSRGDKVTYGEEDVLVNVLDEGYDRLEVYKTDVIGDVKVKEITVEGTPDVELCGLSPGSYRALLTRQDSLVSDAVMFEILQTDVSISMRGKYIDISFFSDNAVPEYIVFCKEDGTKALVSDITDEERLSGHKVVKSEVGMASHYLKVFFRGEYGRVSNPIIPLQ